MGQSVVQVTPSQPTDFLYFSLILFVSNRVFCHYRAFYVQSATVKSTNFAPAATSLANELHGACRKRRAWHFAPHSWLSSAGGKAYIELPALFLSLLCYFSLPLLCLHFRCDFHFSQWVPREEEKKGRSKAKHNGPHRLLVYLLTSLK